MGDDCVLKRNGRREPFSFDKILQRVKNLGQNELQVNYSSLVQKIIARLYDGISTEAIDKLMAQQCASLITTHPDYGTLASRLLISNHHKVTDDCFRSVVTKLYNFNDVHGNNFPLVSKELYDLTCENEAFINDTIVHDNDYLLDYFGFKTLERAYLLRIDDVIVERPQYMWMRVALSIHRSDLSKVKTTYNYMSQKYFTHATPTLFNAGTPRPQLSSCYLLAMEDDSIDGIYSTLTDCAKISKWAGGIGLHIHNIRAAGSHIRGTNGTSNGIAPMLRVYNNTARYVDQGGGKRNGSFAIYMSPWHADVEDFLEMKKNHGDEEARARDLFYALWISDLFMKRVNDGAKWTLMCPHKCPGLSDACGEDFVKLYEEYEAAGKGNKVMEARDLWFKILDSQIETGTPYMLYKDACNQKSNQKNLGTIKSSNLCTEIIEYSDEKETAVCNLASIGLPKFVNSDGTFNYDLLHEVTKIITDNLNKVIDINFYPTVKTQRSNFLHRPVGIGVQGLADVFAMMNIAFHSEEAKTVNKHIFETIYHAALEKSNELAEERMIPLNNLRLSYNQGVWDFQPAPSARTDKRAVLRDEEPHCRSYTGAHDWRDGREVGECLREHRPAYGEMNIRDPELAGAYSSFEGSPAAAGILQFDMWKNYVPTNRYDWASLKSKIVNHGLRNSLLIAPMPTASTSQILGNNECFEPFTSNIYVRRTIAGEFVIVNKHLLNELIGLGLWDTDMKNSIIANQGSIQHLENIPQSIRDKYKIVWEIPMRHILDMAKDRGAYIDQSQSTNLWMENPSYDKLTAMHFYAWRSGLKTGIYYLRTKAKAAPQQFTIAPKACVPREDGVCEMCSS